MDANPKNRLGHRLFAARKESRINPLRLGQQAAAGETLQDAREDEERQVGREAAQHGGHGETDERKQQVVLFAEAIAEPRGQRDDHDVGARVAG